MMQSLGRQYVRYVNGCYGRSGTLWEGPYNSCLVQGEDYLLHFYGYNGSKNESPSQPTKKEANLNIDVKLTLPPVFTPSFSKIN
jgi:hypothetical protein